MHVPVLSSATARWNQQALSTLGADSAFREDALARLTLAYAELGKNGECRRAKDRYLKSYPNGTYKDAGVRALRGVSLVSSLR